RLRREDAESREEILVRRAVTVFVQAIADAVDGDGDGGVRGHRDVVDFGAGVDVAEQLSAHDAVVGLLKLMPLVARCSQRLASGVDPKRVHDGWPLSEVSTQINRTLLRWRCAGFR